MKAPKICGVNLEATPEASKIFSPNFSLKLHGNSYVSFCSSGLVLFVAFHLEIIQLISLYRIRKLFFIICLALNYWFRLILLRYLSQNLFQIVGQIELIV